ncbi:hypothetical protein GN956_G3847 [Arapaima gigas]
MQLLRFVWGLAAAAALGCLLLLVLHSRLLQRGTASLTASTLGFTIRSLCFSPPVSRCQERKQLQCGSGVSLRLPHTPKGRCQTAALAVHPSHMTAGYGVRTKKRVAFLKSGFVLRSSPMFYHTEFNEPPVLLEGTAVLWVQHARRCGGTCGV